MAQFNERGQRGKYSLQSFSREILTLGETYKSKDFFKNCGP